jgi:hypothetical protein
MDPSPVAVGSFWPQIFQFVKSLFKDQEFHTHELKWNNLQLQFCCPDTIQGAFSVPQQHQNISDILNLLRHSSDLDCSKVPLLLGRQEC